MNLLGVQTTVQIESKSNDGPKEMGISHGSLGTAMCPWPPQKNEYLKRRDYI